MVPGSTFKEGSHFWRVTRRPRLSSRQPIDAAATPLPREDTTPPVTKIYFGPIRSVPATKKIAGRETGLKPPERCWRTTHSTGKERHCQRAAEIHSRNGKKVQGHPPQRMPRLDELSRDRGQIGQSSH